MGCRLAGWSVRRHKIANSRIADLVGNSTSPPRRNGTFPPAITKINGQDAAAFLGQVNLKYGIYQDPDSQWNSQFQSYASPNALPIIAASLFFQGPSITLTYDNGQEKAEDSIALVRKTVDFAGVRSGEDYYNKFCNPDPSAVAKAFAAAAVETATTMTGSATPSPTTIAPPSSATNTALAPPAPTIAGYPLPVVRDNGANVTSGYFLNGTGYDDVAVLAISAFAPSGDFDSLTFLTNFQDTVGNFLLRCKQANKKRLVIDVTANGGGFVVAGYDLFAQVGPAKDLLFGL